MILDLHVYHSFCVRGIIYLPKLLQALRERMEPQEKSLEVSYHFDYYVFM
jgi:hypothetical protein